MGDGDPRSRLSDGIVHSDARLYFKPRPGDGRISVRERCGGGHAEGQDPASPARRQRIPCRIPSAIWDTGGGGHGWRRNYVSRISAEAENAAEASAVEEIGAIPEKNIMRPRLFKLRYVL